MQGILDTKEPGWSSMEAADVSVIAGWCGILCGIIAGAGIGLRFHDESWAGGYGSFRRRMLRLGHIAFFGLGFVNLLFGLTVKALGAPVPNQAVAAGSLVFGGITMPLCCYLTAWRERFRHLFPVPVISVAVGTILVLVGWFSR